MHEAHVKGYNKHRRKCGQRRWLRDVPTLQGLALSTDIERTFPVLQMCVKPMATPATVKALG